MNSKALLTEVVSESIPEVPKKKSLMGGAYKFSEMDKQLMVAMHAQGVTSSEIVERMRLEHNIHVSISQVYKYAHSPKWLPTIRKIREKYLEDISSVAGSHKKVRLQRGENIYDKAIGKNKLDLALKAVEAQRKEMEDGASVHLTMNQFNMLSDDELVMKQREALEKIKRLSQMKGIISEQPTNQAEATGT